MRTLVADAQRVGWALPFPQGIRDKYPQLVEDLEADLKSSPDDWAIKTLLAQQIAERGGPGAQERAIALGREVVADPRASAWSRSNTRVSMGEWLRWSGKLEEGLAEIEKSIDDGYYLPDKAMASLGDDTLSLWNREKRARPLLVRDAASWYERALVALGERIERSKSGTLEALKEGRPPGFPPLGPVDRVDAGRLRVWYYGGLVLARLLANDIEAAGKTARTLEELDRKEGEGLRWPISRALAEAAAGRADEARRVLDDAYDHSGSDALKAELAHETLLVGAKVKQYGLTVPANVLGDWAKAKGGH
jgi:hypothetical protein